jgi:hypothetical protein
LSHIPTKSSTTFEALIFSCTLIALLATVTRAQESPQPSPVKVEMKSFVFEVKTCTKLGDRITCELLVTNTAGDRSLAIHNRQWSVNLGGTRLIDDLGNEYNEPVGRLGVKALGTERTVLVTDIPVKATIYFDGVKPESTAIRLLAIECTLFTEHDYEYFIALLRDVPLIEPRLRGEQEQELNSSHVVTTRELTFRAESCKRVAGTVVCTLSVTNESSNPQTLIVDATCSKSRPRLIDDAGTEYGPRNATIGTERISGVSPNCYAQQPIAGKGIMKASLVFENVDAKVRDVKLLRLTTRIGQWDKFTVDFKDIAIQKE